MRGERHRLNGVENRPVNRQNGETLERWWQMVGDSAYDRSR